VCLKDSDLGRTSLRAKYGDWRCSEVEDQCRNVVSRRITAANVEVAVQARRRELVWIERKNFQGWACSECAWAFNPSGPLVGDSLGDMKMHYEQQRDKEFKSHVCTEHSGAKKNPG
jgi:hypothetical protein